MASKQFRVPVNPDVLVWARKSIDYAPEYVAEKLKLQLTQLKNLEAGREKPTYDIILKMSNLYKRPVAAFLLNEQPKEKPLPTDCRTIKSEEVGHFHDKTILTVRRARGLLQAALELRKEMGIKVPVFKIHASLDEQPEKIAAKIRKFFNVSELWDIGKTILALDALIERFEDQGIFVFQLSLTQDKLRGFSLLDEAVPVIVIKRGSEQPTAKTFTLFHELGHILLRQAGMCDMVQSPKAKEIEKWCNQFASEVLLPLDKLLSHKIIRDNIAAGNKKWKATDLASIGNIYNVGPEVVLRKLLNAGYTTRQFYEERHKQWSKNKGFGKGGGRDKVKESVQERGRTFTRLALSAFENNKISRKELADYLDIKIDQVQKVQEVLA